MSVLYHGGVRGLEVGGLLLPPATTGARSLAAYGGRGVTRRDHVYLTSSRDDAAFYALMQGRGSVYRAEPIGHVEPDPDYFGDATVVSAPAARILEVVRAGVLLWHGLTAAQAAAAIREGEAA